MASDSLGNTIRRWLLQLPGGDSLTDARLLEQFVSSHDSFAFAELMRRHGPMVLRVCQRVLRHRQDAEDAFQATFILLARKAGKVGQAHLLGGWLYRVAYRVAVDARESAGKNRAVERPFDDTGTADRVGTPVTAGWDVRPVLDEELARLPEKYRLPVVLCYLGDKTNEEAARLLDLPVGTVKFRLARARDRLRDQLQRRGLALSAGTLATVLAQETVTAALPAAVVGNLVQAAKLTAEGQAIAEGLISSQALLWARAAQTSAPIKLKLSIGALLACLLLLGTGAAVKWTASTEATDYVSVSAEAADPAARKKVLVVTETRGYEHLVLARKGREPSLVERTLHELAAKSGAFELVLSRDAQKDITADNLRSFDAVLVFASGKLPLAEDQKTALLAFLQSGKGFVGVHTVGDMAKWKGYDELLGPQPWDDFTKGTFSLGWGRINVRVEDAEQPATRHLGKEFTLTDRVDIRPSPFPDRCRVLLRLDPSSIRDWDVNRIMNKNKNRKDTAGKRLNLEDCPLAWTHDFGKGRVFYTTLGRQKETWLDENFQKLLLGGLAQVLRLDPASVKLTAPLKVAPTVPQDEFQPEEGFTSLLNGKDLSGWYYTNRMNNKDLAAKGAKEELAGKTATKSGRVVAEAGLIVCHEGKGEWGLFTTKEFKDFILRFEFRTEQSGWVDSGTWARVGHCGNSGQFNLGGRGDVRDGRWHAVEVTVTGTGGTAVIDGKHSILRSDKDKALPITGPIGLQAFVGPIEFRRVRIKEMPR